jgi:3-dehydroquinate dehydratase-2
MHRLLVLQGANMAYLGRRQPEIYGTTSAAELDDMIRAHARKHRYGVEIFYTHVEGEAIGRLYRAVDENVDGVVMNPAGFLYAGGALRDCVRALPYPVIEVHISNIERRGMKSITAEACAGVIAGFGLQSYLMGLEAMLARLAGAKQP